jgi:hypothetical protein
MHAALMTLCSVPVPLPGCCSWAVEQQRYHARVGSIPHVFQAAAAEAIEQLDPELPHQAPQAAGGEAQISADVVKAVWDRLLPGERQQCCLCYTLPDRCHTVC